MAITIIGLPWAWAAFNMASYTLLLFGRKAVSRAQYPAATNRHRTVRLCRQLIWLVLAGWWLALGHLITAVLLGDHHRRHPVRLGAPEAGRHRAMADRQGDRAGGRGAAAADCTNVTVLAGGATDDSGLTVTIRPGPQTSPRHPAAHPARAIAGASLTTR